MFHKPYIIVSTERLFYPFFLLRILEDIKTNILSYYKLKLLCQQKSYSLYKFFGNLNLKNHCQLFSTQIIFFLFEKLAFYMENMILKQRSSVFEGNTFFSKYLKGLILIKIIIKAEVPLKWVEGTFVDTFCFFMTQP